MTPRENFQAALRFQPPDELPWEMHFSPAVRDRFVAATGHRGELSEFYDWTFRYVDTKSTRLKTDFSPWLAPQLPPGRACDGVSEWGVGTLRGSMYHFTDYVHPLAHGGTIGDIERFPFPDTDADYRWAGLDEDVAAVHAAGYAAIPGIDGSLFERAWSLRGLENLLCDFLTNADYADALLDVIEARVTDGVRRASAAGGDLLLLGDDIATQRGLMMSPAVWRRFIKPRLARIIAAARAVKPDVLALYHSDGDLTVAIDELVEVGVDVLNPVQPECMDPRAIRRRYGRRLAFWGTVGTQTTMPFGRPADVRRAVRDSIDALGRSGGLLVSPTHTLEPDVPWENIEAFVQACREFARAGR